MTDASPPFPRDKYDLTGRVDALVRLLWRHDGPLVLDGVTVPRDVINTLEHVAHQLHVHREQCPPIVRKPASPGRPQGGGRWNYG